MERGGTNFTAGLGGTLNGENMIIFSENEINEMGQNPNVLRAVATIHDIEESKFDSVGLDSSYHKKRRIELNAEADKIEREWLE